MTFYLSLSFYNGINYGHVTCIIQIDITWYLIIPKIVKCPWYVVTIHRRQHWTCSLIHFLWCAKVISSTSSIICLTMVYDDVVTDEFASQRSGRDNLRVSLLLQRFWLIYNNSWNDYRSFKNRTREDTVDNVTLTKRSNFRYLKKLIKPLDFN